jgi:hypothetical protein
LQSSDDQQLATTGNPNQVLGRNTAGYYLDPTR